MLEQLKAHGDRVLEVGNVLNQYRFFQHDVVDKYEIGAGVVNVDVTDFRPAFPYPCIVSISTLEHVGFDEEQADLTKFEKAVNHLREQCLESQGTMIITVPLGHNPVVDRIVREDPGLLGSIRFLQHGSIWNEWFQVPNPGAKKVAYNYERHHAEIVALCMLKKL